MAGTHMVTFSTREQIKLLWLDNTKIYVIYFSICNGATQITVARWLTGQLLFNYYKTSVYGHHRVYDTEARVVITFVHTIIKGAKVGICLFLNEYRKVKTSKV